MMCLNETYRVGSKVNSPLGINQRPNGKGDPKGQTVCSYLPNFFLFIHVKSIFCIADLNSAVGGMSELIYDRKKISLVHIFV